VTSPDTIFRKLTHLVDVHMRYRGHPGTFNAVEELATVDGWHTSKQIVVGKHITGNSYESTIRLDLNELAARAEAAATATGIEASDAVAVTITAQVTAPGQTTFSAPMKFNLAPLQFGPADNADLIVADTTPPTTTVKARTIGWLGIGATTARGWAILLLLGAGAGGVLVLLSVRRNAPLSTRAEIERRYPQLLVPVEPMASPPGKPVVNVDSFPALVKLSERYGQMILTWRRPDADDFVVRDEGITYRYRAPLDEPALQNVDLIDRPGNHRRREASEVS
jgi:hypothetical protein